MRERALSHSQPSRLGVLDDFSCFEKEEEKEEEVEKGLMRCQKVAVTPVGRLARSLAKLVGNFLMVFCVL